MNGSGGPEHLAARWEYYLARKAEEGKPLLEYDEWKKRYDINIDQANRVDEAVQEIAKDFPWGSTDQVLIDTPYGGRKHDIIDPDNPRGIEVKVGKTFDRGSAVGDSEIMREVTRDRYLVEEAGWDITWLFYVTERPPSEPLIEELLNANVKVEINDVEIKVIEDLDKIRRMFGG